MWISVLPSLKLEESFVIPVTFRIVFFCINIFQNISVKARVNDPLKVH